MEPSVITNPGRDEAAAKPLRVLHLLAGSDAGGLSRYVFDLAFAMHARGHDITVAGERGAWHWLFDSAPFAWVDVPLRGGFFSLRRSADRLRRHLDEHPADVMHVHYRRSALVARQIQKTHPIPILFTVHLSNIPMSWPWRRFSDFGDHTHVASDEARQWLIDTAGVSQELISIIPHGIDSQRFPLASEESKSKARDELRLLPTDLVAAYVGRLDFPKNEGWLLDLAGQSRDRLPNLKVILLGEGPHAAALRRRVLREKLQSRVFLLGHGDPRPVYQAADALLLPSCMEGFSLVCAEAMSSGIPVLRTRTAGTRALIVENTTGVSVPIDHDAFVSAAMDFLSDRAGLCRMGQLAALRVKENFTFERQLSDTVDLYRSVVKLYPK